MGPAPGQRRTAATAAASSGCSIRCRGACWALGSVVAGIAHEDELGATSSCHSASELCRPGTTRCAGRARSPARHQRVTRSTGSPRLGIDGGGGARASLLWKPRPALTKSSVRRHGPSTSESFGDTWRRCRGPCCPLSRCVTSMRTGRRASPATLRSHGVSVDAALPVELCLAFRRMSFDACGARAGRARLGVEEADTDVAQFRGDTPMPMRAQRIAARSRDPRVAVLDLYGAAACAAPAAGRVPRSRTATPCAHCAGSSKVVRRIPHSMTRSDGRTHRLRVRRSEYVQSSSSGGRVAAALERNPRCNTTAAKNG